MVFGSLVSSVAVVILVVILGLRYLDGTLGGVYAAGSLLLSLLFLAVISVVLILSLTDWLTLGGKNPNTGRRTALDTDHALKPRGASKLRVLL